MNSSHPHHVEVLRNELRRRKCRNPRYSLRAFAQSLRLDPSGLSRILSSKHDLTPELCEKILVRLNLPPGEHALFIASVVERRRARMQQALASRLGGRAVRTEQSEHRHLTAAIALRAREISDEVKVPVEHVEKVLMHMTGMGELRAGTSGGAGLS